MGRSEVVTDTKRSKNRLIVTLWGIIFLLLVSNALFITSAITGWGVDWWENLKADAINEKAPYYTQVKKIIDGQYYSGLAAMLRDDVYLDLDFKGKKWFIRNLQRYEENGQAILEMGKYGTCGQLAYYTYHQIRPLFDQRYNIRFIRVSESQYFPVGKGLHFALKITDLSNPFEPVTYILDPAFRKYGPIDEFVSYEFYESESVLEFAARRGPDEVHPVNNGTPIYIRRSHLLSLSVDDVEGRYDKNNFMIRISALKKHNYANHGLYAIRMRDGRIEFREDKELIEKLLPEEQHRVLRKLADKFFDQLSRNSKKAA